MTLDRNSASQESDIHLTITDQQLNIDPTGKDVVIFYVGLSGSEAVAWQNRTQATPSVTAYTAFDNTFDDNGKLLINNATNGGASILAMDATLDDTTADNLIVFYETAENSGVFVNTDDIDDSNIDVAYKAPRGKTATFDYNDSAQSFVVANDFGVIDMDASSVGDEWNSGEALTVTLIDQDLNKNSASDEDLTIQNTTKTHLIPTLTFGNPVSVEKGSDAAIEGNATKYSKIVYYTNASIDATTGATKPYVIANVFKGSEINAIDTVNTYFNYDVRSFGNATDAVASIALLNSAGAEVVSETTTGLGIVEIGSAALTALESATGEMKVTVTTTLDSGADIDKFVSIPVVLDVMSFGNTTNNAIYRILLEETDDNTATFEGSIEFTMLNQINVNLDATYTSLATID
jgi:hypothetical protein